MLKGVQYAYKDLLNYENHGKNHYRLTDICNINDFSLIDSEIEHT